MAEDEPRKIIQPLDGLVCWWKHEQGKICKTQHMIKEYNALTGNIEDYRRKTHDVLTEEYHLKYAIFHICSVRLLKSKPDQDLETAKDCFCRRWGDAKRRLGHINAGFAIQVLVTRWIYEAGFPIADIEVKHRDSKGCEHSFDVEMEDKNGDKYDVEIWHGRGVMAHERDSSADSYLTDLKGRPLCREKGVWKESMKYVSEHGGIGDDSDANWRNLMKKIRQLRKDHDGFVIACMGRELPPTPQFIPMSWGPKLPPKKCIIVLQLDGGDAQTAERRGIGYVVPSPGFDSTAAESIIRSMKFKCVDGDSDEAKFGFRSP